jgi:hypothetical protein
MSDCPYCRAPAPIAGEIEHAWDCMRPPYGRFLPDPPNAGWLDDGRTPEQAAAALLALARQVEYRWRLGAGRQIILPRATETRVSSNT